MTQKNNSGPPEGPQKGETPTPGTKPGGKGGKPKEQKKPAAATPAPKKEGPRPARRAGLWLPVLASVALIAALAVGAAGVFGWYQLAERQSAHDQALKDLKGRLDRTLPELEAETSRLSTTLAEVQRQERDLQNSLEALHTELGRGRREWAIAEIEYYLRIANQRLQLLRDVDTATTALKLADQRLRALGDPALYEVRQRISDEVTALEATERVDLTGAALQLGSLAQSVQSLPLPQRSRAPLTDEEAGPGETAESAEPQNWKEYLYGAWDVFKQLVVVRRTDQPVAPLLPPESEFFLYQNLRLQLESSRLALLHGEPEAYRDHLHTARDWVKSYFDTEAAPTRAMLNKIGELAALEIRPELPDISGSLHALQRVAGSNAQAEAQGRQSAEPSSPAEAPAAEEQPAPAAQPPATADEAAQPQAAPEGGTP